MIIPVYEWWAYLELDTFQAYYTVTQNHSSPKMSYRHNYKTEHNYVFG